MYSGSSSGSSYLPTMRPDYLFLKYVLSDTGSQRRGTLNAPVSVTSLAFDHQEELLWMGNERGHVTSYYGLGMSKYTSFQVHAQHDIRAQLTGEYGLLSLSKNSLRMSIRRGLTVFDHTSDYFKDMYCMSRTENPNVILMAGQQSEVLEFDLEKVKAIRVTEISDENSGCMIIRNHPKFACCGDASGKVSSWRMHDLITCPGVKFFSPFTSGLLHLSLFAQSSPLLSLFLLLSLALLSKFLPDNRKRNTANARFISLFFFLFLSFSFPWQITLRDKKTLSIQHTFSSHSGQLSDFDVRGNHLITCGYSKRNGNYNIDRFLMVYDLRMVKAIAPIGMTFAPFLLRFVPVYASKFCVVSQTGQFQLMDTSASVSTPPPFLHNIDLPPGAAISAFDVSNSSQALSFADTAGYVYLFGASSEILFNPNSQPTEFPDEVSGTTKRQKQLDEKKSKIGSHTSPQINV